MDVEASGWVLSMAVDGNFLTFFLVTIAKINIFALLQLLKLTFFLVAIAKILSLKYVIATH